MIRRSAPWMLLAFPFLAATAAAQDPGTPTAGAKPAAEEAAPTNRLTLKGGLLLEAVSFNSTTSLGARALSPGPITLGRFEWAVDPDESLFVQFSFELAQGKGVQILSGEVDLGIHLLSTELGSCRFDLDAEAGLMVSHLAVSPPGFGTFGVGWGLRAGLAAHLRLARQVSLDASIDFRNISYPWSGSVLSGDQSAQTVTAGLLLGLSLRF